MEEPGKAIQFDLNKLLRLLWKRLWLLMIGALLGTVLALGATKLLVTPQYDSSVTFYVQETLSGKNLADSFSVVVTMRESLMEVIDYTGMPYTHTQLGRQIRVSAIHDTDFFQVTVRAPDAREAAMIANSIGVTLPRQVGKIMEGTTIKMVGEAIPALAPSTPSYPSTAVLGCAAGTLLMLGLVLLKAWLPGKPIRK